MKKIELKELLAIPPAYGANHAAVPYEPGVTHRYVRITDVDENGRLIPEKRVGIPKEVGDPYLTKKGDLLLARSGATVGKSFFVDVDDIYSHAGYLIRFRFDERKVIREYIRQYFNSPNYWSWVSSSIRAGAQPNINAAEYSGLIVPLPPLPEQKKIAEILGACDEAIEAQERLIAQKQERKKGLMQKLLTGEVRFPEFEGTAWREVAIGSLLKEVKRSVKWDDEEQYKLLSLRRRSGGPFARESLYGREIKTKTLKTVHKGDFLIAKMQVTHGALGMVTPEFDQYKVSASYICLVPRDEESFDIRFFNYLSQLRYIWHLAYVASYGVTIEKMTFVPKDFLKKKISVPSTKDECSAIADFINSVNEEITLQQNKLDQLKQQKKGLMQQLLTGKVRVKV